jgi:predicted permease
VSAPRPGGRLVRLVARAMALFYPASFRHEYGTHFADVASHLFERELSRRPPAGAVLVTCWILVADTVAASPALWMTAIGGRPPAMRPPGRLERLGRHVRGGGQDLKVALRSAARRPAFSALVIATLALGTGASTAAFDALDRAILTPLPFERSSELVLLAMGTRQQSFTGVPLPLLQQWREQATTVRQIEVFRRLSVLRLSGEGAAVLDGLGLSGGLPGMLGVRPVIGRMLTPADADPAAHPTVMLTEQFWRTQFGADPDAIGQVLNSGTAQAEIVGVWPAGARLGFGEPPDVIRVLPAGAEYSRGMFVQVLARMQPGRTARDVEVELDALTPAETRRDYRPTAIAPADLLLGERFVTAVWLVFAGGLVLLSASIANAAHLLLERATERAHELGVRIALGGSQARLLRLFLAEGLVYAAGGLAAGALVALGLERLIAGYEPRLYLDTSGAGLAGRSFAFAAVAALACVLACTVAPLLRAERSGVALVLNGGGTRATAFRSHAMHALVGVQAALAVLLAVGAVLMGQSLTRLLSVDPGIDADRLAELSVSLPASRYPSPESRELYLSRATEALRALPGVTGVVTSGMPLMVSSEMDGLPRLDGDPDVEAPPEATTVTASVPPQYFDVLGIRLRDGRLFTDGETDVAVVSQAFAARRGGPIVGRLLYLPGSNTARRIVGVVNDVRYGGLADDSTYRPAVYLPVASRPDSFYRFIVRTDGPPADVIAGARLVLAEIDPAMPLRSPLTGTEVIRRQTSQHRFVAVLLAGLAGLGVVLAMSGVYGAVALSVARRRREIGVRMALGAPPRRLVGRFVAAGLKPVVAGAAAGGLAVWYLAPHVETLLFRVAAHDPLSVAAGIGLVVLTALLAAAIPASRVSRLDPVRALRDA